MQYKIGIICAADTELEPFIQHINDCTITEKAMLKFYEGKINNIEIVTLFCGVCKVNAAIATQILIDTYNVNTIVNAGTAGGMDSSVDIFDTIISTRVAYHDVSDDILTEFHPWMPTVYFDADSHLVQLARKTMNDINSDHKFHFGTMVTGEQFITDECRDSINQMFNPLSVDMETASIAHVCYVNSIPFIAIRTITDNADHSGTDNFEINCEKASEISKDTVLRFLNILNASI